MHSYFLHPRFFLTIDQTCSNPSCRLVFSNQSICYIFVLLNVRFESATSKKLMTRQCSCIKIGAKTRRTVQLIYFLRHSASMVFRIIMPCRRSCHMPFLKLMPPFTLTEVKDIQHDSILIIDNTSINQVASRPSTGVYVDEN